MSIEVCTECGRFIDTDVEETCVTMDDLTKELEVICEGCCK